MAEGFISSSRGCWVTCTTAVLKPVAEKEIVAVLFSPLFADTLATTSQEPFPDSLSSVSQSFSETLALHSGAFVLIVSVCDDASFVKCRASGVTSNFFPCCNCSSLLQKTNTVRHKKNRTKYLVARFIFSSTYF